ncbi:MAG: hypothetical protein A3H50_00905 [Candidatus Levybacteria bacterium RIFCSPLOWO2_02_FULL_37_10]|nr:MAG: hypothetical protein A2860_03465 [Candidatus Levybacteria bacterium RIFCSPHIGHO2_01_FULL_37_33]OGH16395.1 MAG: hypothetical protein A3C97_02680 [Candidatus Levybacteria bacterium RIFCSPHIGHO2_02_FULL_37_11]OGH30295.1 MAG: hypothetical protein A3F30_03520 [Candidatus Levybacteria bacterium RIFCSPHIGHO2_12_FULL_37_12]OGH43162.1 MAG: hypothetical protein A3H50_00905 [Candidatus Levybacteria bacterium RIFCSPLOWO2_02_FULL_37_10]
MKDRVRGFQIIILILIAFFGGYYFGVNKISLDWKGYKPVLSISSKEPPPSLSNLDFSNFWAVWQSLENNYYDKSKLDPAKMLNGAISGLVQSVGDPYTLYLPPVSNNNFKQGLAGQFQGIGAELGMRDNKIIVISPLDASPAIAAGIKPEDVILKVDGVSTTGWSLAQTVEKIRGPKGTAVTLSILHKDSKNPQDIKITRDVIVVKSIDGFIRKVKDMEKIKINSILKAHGNDEVIYLKLSQFGDSTNKDWLALVNKLNLKVQNNPAFKGIILDVRNNPGGYLSDAAFITSEFLKEGTPVVIQETGAGEKSTLRASRRGLFLTTPVVILINKGSASASEIVSGALKDQGRAKLVGETSFGKGTIQQAEDLGNGAGLHVTIAKWLTPNGTWVNGKGLVPDISVSLDPKDQARDSQLEKAIEELVK